MGDLSRVSPGERLPLFVLEDIAETLVSAGDAGQYESESSFSLVAIASGQGMLRYRGSDKRIAKGDSWIVEPAASCEVANSEHEELRLYRLLFKTLPVEHESGEGGVTFRFEFGNVFQVKPLHRLLQSLEALLKRRAADDAIEHFKTHIAFQQLLCQCFEQVHMAEEGTSSRSMIERSLAYMHEHYADELNVKHLAHKASLSVRQYTRLFKEVTGKSPIEYLTEYRIERSKEELLVSDERLLTISRNNGFKDIHYFSRRFKQIVGVSPKQYVRSRKP